jgi:hypothetical protein
MSLKVIAMFNFKYENIIPYRQCFGSESGSALDPHSMGFWIRICIVNADPYPEVGKSTQKRRKIKSEDKKKIYKKLVFSMQSYF